MQKIVGSISTVVRRTNPSAIQMPRGGQQQKGDKSGILGGLIRHREENGRFSQGRFLEGKLLGKNTEEVARWKFTLSDLKVVPPKVAVQPPPFALPQGQGDNQAEQLPDF